MCSWFLLDLIVIFAVELNYNGRFETLVIRFLCVLLLIRKRCDGNAVAKSVSVVISTGNFGR